MNLVRFHGVFAPHFKYRDQVVPLPKKSGSEAIKTKKSGSMTWAQRLKRVELILRLGLGVEDR